MWSSCVFCVIVCVYLVVCLGMLCFVLFVLFVCVFGYCVVVYVCVFVDRDLSVMMLCVCVMCVCLVWFCLFWCIHFMFIYVCCLNMFYVVLWFALCRCDVFGWIGCLHVWLYIHITLIVCVLW